MIEMQSADPWTAIDSFRFHLHGGHSFTTRNQIRDSNTYVCPNQIHCKLPVADHEHEHEHEHELLSFRTYAAQIPCSASLIDTGLLGHHYSTYVQNTSTRMCLPLPGPVPVSLRDDIIVLQAAHSNVIAHHKVSPCLQLKPCTVPRRMYQDQVHLSHCSWFSEFRLN